jgi:hypothetical protein
MVEIFGYVVQLQPPISSINLVFWSLLYFPLIVGRTEELGIVEGLGCECGEADLALILEYKCEMKGSKGVRK